jgi:hypothetical protein
MREIEVPPPPNPPAFSYRQFRTYWLVVCMASVFTAFFFYEYFHGSAKAEIGALWLMLGLNVGGHALLIPAMIRAHRWEEQNQRNILEALHAQYRE